MDLVVLPPWIPEDDLLLKNAVEAGASLESLAKGAVQFSRKYSITELRDRWRSLLYDPDVSAEASASMATLEQFGKAEGGFKEVTGEGTAAKRKAPSIRKQYYAMRKKLCRQVFDNLNMALHDEIILDDDVNDELGRNDSIDNAMSNLDSDNLVDYGSYSSLGDVGQSHLMSDVPFWKMIEDVSAPAMLVQVSPENKDHGMEEARAKLPHVLKGKYPIDVLNASAAMPGQDIVRLSESLLNMTKEDELLAMDVKWKDVADKQCYENIDSLLLSSPCEILGNDPSDICRSQKLDTDAKAAVPSSSSATQLEVVANPLHCSHGDVRAPSDPGNNCQSSVSAQSPQTKLHEECMFCVLNTEDPDVPSNDNVDLSIVVPPLLTLKTPPIAQEAGYSDPSIINQRKKDIEGCLKKEEKPSHSFASSEPRKVQSGLVPNMNLSDLPIGVVKKTENPIRNPIPAVCSLNNNPISVVPTQSNNPISVVSRPSNNVNINPSHSRLGHAIITPSVDGHLKQEEIDALASAIVYAHPKAGEHKDVPEVKSLTLNQEVDNDDDDNDDADDYGNEVPSFSDAEAMILEMDLCPTDQDTNAGREVSRYQHDETKKTIMRLEQCAQSFMQRAIASQRAFAVLYGRNLKQYINKSEVILGRGTDDTQVDIDLRREGCANKISRRQALIKMQANGSFIIKNLGKSSIFLNGNEVAPEQMRILNASNLIEIRGMSFIFETNNKSVRRYLENMDKGENKKKAFTMVAGDGVSKKRNDIEGISEK